MHNHLDALNRRNLYTSAQSNSVDSSLTFSKSSILSKIENSHLRNLLIFLFVCLHPKTPHKATWPNFILLSFVCLLLVLNRKDTFYWCTNKRKKNIFYFFNGPYWNRDYAFQFDSGFLKCNSERIHDHSYSITLAHLIAILLVFVVVGIGITCAYMCVCVFAQAMEYCCMTGNWNGIGWRRYFDRLYRQ